MVQNHTGYKDLLSGTSPGRVSQEKMSGRHSMKKRTISGLEIIDIDTKENLLVIKGSIPGKSGNLVSIRTN
jgi:large subunit ribosomal protein L3